MYTHKRALSLLLSLLLCLSMLSSMTALAETTCPHTNATRTNVTYETHVGDANGHHVVYETRVRVTCPDCGYVDSGTLADEQPDPGPVEPHTFVDGGCSVCNYVCAHANKVLSSMSDYYDGDATPVDALTHSGTYIEQEYWKCLDCGQTLSVVNRTENHVEKHRWGWDGTCYVCGFVNTCAHANKRLLNTYNYIENDAEPVDAFTHSGTYTEEQHWICDDCDQQIAVSIPHTDKLVEKHYWSDEVCWACGYVNTCTHPSKSLLSFTHYCSYDAKPVDALTHSGTYIYEEEWECDDCGLRSTTCTNLKENFVENHDWDDDGVCWHCGFENPCAHNNKFLALVDDHYYSASTKPVDALTHSKVMIEQEGWECADCGQMFYIDTGRTETVVVPHEWDDDGVRCYECDYKNTCTHPNGLKTIDTFERELKVLDRNETNHVLLVQRIQMDECPDCGFVREYEVGEPYSVTREHEWGEEFCWSCGQFNSCTHANLTYSYYNDYIRVISSDEHGHHTLNAFQKYTECADCGAHLGSQIVSKSEQYESHSYSMTENKCNTCGYRRTPCTHPNMIITKRPDGSVIDILSKNEQGHTVTVYESISRHCPDCDYYDWEETQNVCTRENEPHSWNRMIISGNSCYYCGYVNPCQHTNYELVDEYEARIGVTTANDANEHTVIVQKYQERYCRDCKSYILDDIGDPYPVTEEHSWSKDNCSSCSYPNLCEHAHVHEEVLEIAGTIIASSQEGHTCNVTKRTLKVCDDCEASWWNGLSDETSDAKLFPHSTDIDGKTSIICRICDFDQLNGPTETPAPVVTETPAPVVTETPAPVATETPAPVATETPAPVATETPAPTAAPTKKPTATEQPMVPPLEPIESEIPYDDVPETETVHGVTAAEPQRMAETLVTAIDAIEQENEGASVSIAIVNVEKVVTAEEKAELDALPAKEQILVLLSAIGYDTEVQAALSSMDMELSTEAIALTQAIQERIATASDEEKAAFEALLLECFPVETVMIDGEPVDYFVIELQVEVDGEIHFERYGFRFDENGEWIFARLSISEITE